MEGSEVNRATVVHSRLVLMTSGTQSALVSAVTDDQQRLHFPHIVLTDMIDQNLREPALCWMISAPRGAAGEITLTVVGNTRLMDFDFIGQCWWEPETGGARSSARGTVGDCPLSEHVGAAGGGGLATPLGARGALWWHASGDAEHPFEYTSFAGTAHSPVAHVTRAPFLFDEAMDAAAAWRPRDADDVRLRSADGPEPQWAAVLHPRTTRLTVFGDPGRCPDDQRIRHWDFGAACGTPIEPSAVHDMAITRAGTLVLVTSEQIIVADLAGAFAHRHVLRRIPSPAREHIAVSPSENQLAMWSDTWLSAAPLPCVHGHGAGKGIIRDRVRRLEPDTAQLSRGVYVAGGVLLFPATGDFIGPPRSFWAFRDVLAKSILALLLGMRRQDMRLPDEVLCACLVVPYLGVD